MIFWENVTFHKNLFTMLWSQDENESIVVWCHFHTPPPHVSYRILTENLITKLNEVKWLINYFCFTIILMNRIGHWTKTQDAKSNCTWYMVHCRQLSALSAAEITSAARGQTALVTKYQSTRVDSRDSVQYRLSTIQYRVDGVNSVQYRVFSV